jgi:serine/threonine-protein kinase
VGQRFGRYETLDIIGSGGMATVYLGRAVGEGGFERLVAIKAMHPHVADSADGLASFLDEARLAALIRHPNVVSTIDVQKSADGAFMVMEYIEGPSLAALMRAADASGEWPPREVLLRVVIDVLSGLQAAHELSDNDGAPLHLIHRDVSPHNILVGDDGIARITDFGVARAEARLSASTQGKVKGKLAYMAPEHAYGDAMDRRADIYSAGVVLWELLAHQRLFQAEQQGKLLSLVLAGARRSPRAVDDTVPEAISEVCMRALAHDPSERFASAQAFADELEDACQLASVALPSRRRLERFVRDFMREQSIEPRAPQVGGGDSSSSGMVPAARGSMRSLTGEGDDAGDVTMTATLAESAPSSRAALADRDDAADGDAAGDEAVADAESDDAARERSAALRHRARVDEPMAAPRSAQGGSRSRLLVALAALLVALAVVWSLSSKRGTQQATGEARGSARVAGPDAPGASSTATVAPQVPEASASAQASAPAARASTAPAASTPQAPTEQVRATPKNGTASPSATGEPHGPSGFRPGDL